MPAVSLESNPWGQVRQEECGRWGSWIEVARIRELCSVGHRKGGRTWGAGRDFGFVFIRVTLAALRGGWKEQGRETQWRSWSWGKGCFPAVELRSGEEAWVAGGLH